MRSGWMLAVGMLCLVLAGRGYAQAEAEPAQPADPVAPRQVENGLSLTVYSNADPAQFDPQRFMAQQRQGNNPQFVWQVPGFGVVRSVREVDFEQGLNQLQFTDVAQFIDPTSVSFVDLSDPEATAVLEQQFEFDLVSPEKLLERYLDEEVTLLVDIGNGERETVTGTLLSMVAGQLVIRTDEGIRLIRHGTQVQVVLGDLPGGLVTRPTLSWLVRSADAGQRQVRTSYQTDGITWRADYNLVLGPDDSTADLSAWVTLLNLSGTAYQNAQLKLIAGDVQRIQPRPEVYRVERQRLGMDVAAEAFEQQAFFEYHLYTLPRRTDVPQNATKQITLFPTATDVEVRRVLVYYGLPEHMRWGFTPQARTERELGHQSNPQVDVYVEFENRENNNLGVPLPRGKMRVFKENPDDGALEFVGEDLINHTPRNEKVLIKVGQAFDVVGERVQTNFRREGRIMEESFRIRVRNQKDEPERVIIRESLFRWVEWEIAESSDEYEKIDARTIHFEVEVPAEGQKEVTYTVRYRLW